jgi:hypothetical protein
MDFKIQKKLPPAPAPEQLATFENLNVVLNDHLGFLD